MHQLQLVLQTPPIAGKVYRVISYSLHVDNSEARIHPHLAKVGLKLRDRKPISLTLPQPSPLTHDCRTCLQLNSVGSSFGTTVGESLSEGSRLAHGF